MLSFQRVGTEFSRKKKNVLNVKAKTLENLKQ